MTDSSRPLAGSTFGLVGPGRVGASLASWSRAAGAECRWIAGRAPSRRAEELAANVGGRAVRLDAGEAPPPEVDWIWCATPDDAVADAARTLVRSGARARVALHAAGALAADALAPLAVDGVALGAMHPLRAFPRAELAVEAAGEITFGVDGDVEALAWIDRLAAAWGARTVLVPASGRLLYHQAAVLAAGGVATLLAAAAELALAGGLEADRLRDGHLALARSAIAGVAAASTPARAITGPAARGDLATLAAETRAVRDAAPDWLPLVVELARSVARLRGGLSELAPEGSDDRRRELARALVRLDFLDLVEDRVLTS